MKSEQSMACPRWLNGFMAAGFHSGLISLSELKLEYMKAHRNAYGERMTEAQEQSSWSGGLLSYVRWINGEVKLMEV